MEGQKKKKKKEKKKVTSRSNEFHSCLKILFFSNECKIKENFMERVERERERERGKFYVINVKYKEIPQGKRKEEEEKSNFQKHRGTRA